MLVTGYLERTNFSGDSLMSALSKIKHIILFEMILIFFSSVVMSETAEKTNVALRTSQG